MSFDTLAWARRARTGSPARKAVLMVLAEHADEQHSCYPSQRLIADATEQSVRTVRRQLADLEAAGLVSREPRQGPGNGRSSDRYYLPVPPANLTGAPGHSYDPTPPATAVTGAPGHSSGRVTPLDSQSELPPNRAQLQLVDDADGLPAAQPEPEGAELWGAFWQAYPRKVAKGAARAAWRAAVKAAAGADLVAAAERYRDDPNREDRYTKHPATWLRGECWADPPLPSRTGVRAEPVADRSAPSGRVAL